MVGKLEKARGNTPPMLDLETLKSDLVVADSTDEVWPSTSWKGFVGWTLAAIVAIVAGVIPALWINRWRGEADAAAAPAVEAKHVETTPIETPAAETPTPPAAAAPAAQPQVEPIAVAAPPAPPPVATVEAKTKTVKKPVRRPNKVKQVVRPSKKIPPPCDIYLHPHGCPR